MEVNRKPLKGRAKIILRELLTFTFSFSVIAVFCNANRLLEVEITLDSCALPRKNVGADIKDKSMPL